MVSIRLLRAMRTSSKITLSVHTLCWIKPVSIRHHELVPSNDAVEAAWLSSASPALTGEERSVPNVYRVDQHGREFHGY